MSELKVPVTPQLRRRIRIAAARAGVTESEYALRALETVVPEMGTSEPKADAPPTLLARYAKAGISWTGQALPQREPVGETHAGKTLTELLIEDRR